jgi:hypothetical protein
MGCIPLKQGTGGVMANKTVPIILMIVGAAILIGVGLFALDNARNNFRRVSNNFAGLMTCMVE